MKNRILTLILTIIIILPMFLSSCADETGISIESSTADKSFLKELKYKAGFDDEEDTTPNAEDNSNIDLDLSIISLTEIVDKSETARIKIKGKPNTKYSISVIYNSGPSEAGGLEPKYSDDEGFVTWSWKIGGRTAYGTYDIKISDGSGIYKTNFTVGAHKTDIKLPETVIDTDLETTEVPKDTKAPEITQVPETTDTPQTTEAPETTKAPETSDKVEYDITIVEKTEVVGRNEKASITIKGKPNTKYSIQVIYNSGPSKAKGLEDTYSDGDGFVTWTWKVGGKTALGTYNIRITGGGGSCQTTFTVG